MYLLQGLVRGEGGHLASLRPAAYTDGLLGGPAFWLSSIILKGVGTLYGLIACIISGDTDFNTFMG